MADEVSNKIIASDSVFLHPIHHPPPFCYCIVVLSITKQLSRADVYHGHMYVGFFAAISGRGGGGAEAGQQPTYKGGGTLKGLAIRANILTSVLPISQNVNS